VKFNVLKNLLGLILKKFQKEMYQKALFQLE